MKNNLSLAGSEIINESKSKYNNYSNISTSPVNEQKIILKSYKITDPQTLTSNNNSTKIKNVITEKRELKTSKINTLDLSKIKYNDGYILTDAANSNPGFGLWALKLPSQNEENDLKSNNSDINRKSINNISIIKNNVTNISNKKHISFSTNNINLSKNKNSDKSLNISKISKNDDIKQKNKLLIEYLKMKCNDLEKKCTNLVSNLDQKIYMCNNSIKLKREYEKLLQDNIKDTKLIKEKSNSLSLENGKLNNVYNKIEIELNRLLKVISKDKENMQKLKEEYNTRLIEEEKERQRLNIILKEMEKKVESIEEEVNEKTNENKININNNSNHNVEINIKKDSEARKEFEEENLNDIIMELELKICGMKKKINSQEEENDKLRKILRFKEEKNGVEKYQLTNLNYLLQFKKENQKNNLDIVSRQDTLIKELLKKGQIKKNKLSKSVSLKRK